MMLPASAEVDSESSEWWQPKRSSEDGSRLLAVGIPTALPAGKM